MLNPLTFNIFLQNILFSMLLIKIAYRLAIIINCYPVIYSISPFIQIITIILSHTKPLFLGLTLNFNRITFYFIFQLSNPSRKLLFYLLLSTSDKYTLFSAKLSAGLSRTGLPFSRCSILKIRS